MTDVRVNDMADLVERYADRIRTDAAPGRELAYAAGVVEALADVDSRHSNTRRLQKTNALIEAATLVRAERREGPRA